MIDYIELIAAILGVVIAVIGFASPIVNQEKDAVIVKDTTKRAIHADWMILIVAVILIALAPMGYRYRWTLQLLTGCLAVVLPLQYSFYLKMKITRNLFFLIISPILLIAISSIAGDLIISVEIAAFLQTDSVFGLMGVMGGYTAGVGYSVYSICKFVSHAVLLIAQMSALLYPLSHGQTPKRKATVLSKLWIISIVIQCILLACSIGYYLSNM